MGEVWTLAEFRHGKLNPISFELLNRGKSLAQKLDTSLASIIIGYDIKKEDIDELIERGADKVYVVDDKRLENFIVETYAKVILKLLDEYNPDIFIAAATTTGRTLMPYIAVKKQTGLTADCTVLDIEEETGNLLQTRPAIGGNILATIKTPNTRPQMATVRPHSTKPALPDRNRVGEVIYKQFSDDVFSSKTKYIRFIKNESQQVNIQDAKIIVAGGRGLGKAENFKLIDELAELLGGAVGVSRDVVDRGWKTYPHQIGLSGKTVSPALYIAVGISGAIQHIAGMQTSENIIAINKDPDAQIFKIANLGIVGDLNEILPFLIERIKDYKKKEANLNV
ncbi:electron transfer flavoprotein alpha subunit apoprotein [Thermoanaerobacter thermohydrosulfuricus]|uniref:Electron transfer flavoprotein alpha subunit apoprotein n=1 Tax=Thermoanaerobacter thermohydrosulfuricus TaxID=1516 RepID=A0A1G7TFB0_THETY|nr:electron transfer flavoprotein subunit alpha/FixB family protein [Thermoanaerobacter thermohydrosulfuricus]SDG33993.1 electron transfer flavoprotein alpha subunit apoprotein [Thermoanaerobacter thermohydrosulfuricus]